MTPDLTPVQVRRCTAVDHYAERVLSSDGKTVYHVMADHCTCPGFTHRQDCKHVRAIRERVCTWGEVWWMDPVPERCPASGCRKRTSGDGACTEHCPNCGTETTFYTNMV